MPEPFWKLSPAGVPRGVFNCSPGASLNFSWSMAAWLAASGTGLTLDNSGTALIAPFPLLLTATGYAGAIMTNRIEIDPAATVTPGQVVQMNVRFRASDGQRDARTYELMLVPR